MPTLARITIYPIKSLDPMEVSAARLVAGGALEHDRAFAMFTADGKLVTAKRSDRVHALRTTYEPDVSAATFRLEGDAASHRFDLHTQRAACAEFLSDHLGMRVRLEHKPAGGFPDDDHVATGPTVVSAASLAAVASWYDGLSADDIHRRVRVNLVVGDTDAFWEDRLVNDMDHCVGFAVGGVEMLGVSACGRCVVPTRDPRTGAQLRDFQHVFLRQREAHFRPDVKRTERFSHLYRLTTRTSVPASQWGRTLRVGDKVTIGQVQPWKKPA